ncbi:hypothetical protein [Gordonia caeni]|uniref:Uncharacterized protein n=1 Tax=Gordonia caeni TaxID=1007097 RepID=A0ABP7PNJ1_9ACTN
MAFSEVERTIVQKGSGPGADAIGVTENHAAVIDGTTVSEPCDCCGDRAGILAVEAVLEVIDSLAADADLSGFLGTIAETFTRRTWELECRGRAWVASAAMYSASRREVWLIGDSAALVDGSHHQQRKRIDVVAAAFRSVVDRAALAGGATIEELRSDDIGRTAIRPLLTRQRNFRNDLSAGDLAWGALAPEPTPIELCRVVEIPPRTGGQDLVLASDGYPLLWNTLAESEAALAARIRSDPLMIGPEPETKGVEPAAASFDDRAYLRLRLTDSAARP